MDLSIIIVNWNSADYLDQCLSSVYRETGGVDYQIVVVDNASNDDACSRLIHQRFPQAVLHCSSKNLGFARGSNLGCKLSTGDALLFLNPDTQIQDNVFVRMVEHLHSNPGIGAVGARLLNTDRSLQISCVQAYPTIWNQLLDSDLLRNMFPMLRLWGMQPLFAKAGVPAKVDAISGACLMVKREVFSVVGGFDDSYFMYVEDLELCRRITSAGYAIHLMNDCEVIHHGGTSSAKQSDHFANIRQQEALLQYFRASKGSWYCWLYRAALTSVSAMRLIVILSLLPFIRIARRKSNWSFSFHKWSHILRWAVGLGT